MKTSADVQTFNKDFVFSYRQLKKKCLQSYIPLPPTKLIPFLPLIFLFGPYIKLSLFLCCLSMLIFYVCVVSIYYEMINGFTEIC